MSDVALVLTWHCPPAGDVIATDSDDSGFDPEAQAEAELAELVSDVAMPLMSEDGDEGRGRAADVENFYEVEGGSEDIDEESPDALDEPDDDDDDDGDDEEDEDEEDEEEEEEDSEEAAERYNRSTFSGALLRQVLHSGARLHMGHVAPHTATWAHVLDSTFLISA